MAGHCHLEDSFTIFSGWVRITWGLLDRLPCRLPVGQLCQAVVVGVRSDSGDPDVPKAWEL